MKAFSCVLVMLLGLAGCGQPKQQLNIFIWSEYLDPAVIQAFEKQFDCRVNIDLYESPEGMMAKLVAGGDSQYDIVVPSNTTLPALANRGLLAPLRFENIPNWKNLDARFRDLSFDPGGRHGAPYQWGTVGLYLRAPRGQRVEESWGLIFDPARQPGAFLLVDDMRSAIGAALRFKGHSINTTNAQALIEARDLLVGAKRRSLGFEGAVGAKNRVLARGAVLAMAYNLEAVRGVKEDAETRYIVPLEGGEIWMDVLSIPARAPHRDLAEKFINFILEPRVGAQVAGFNRAATPNAAALEFVEAEDRANTAIYPPADVLNRLEYALDLGGFNKLYDELWTQVKSR